MRAFGFFPSVTVKPRHSNAPVRRGEPRGEGGEDARVEGRRLKEAEETGRVYKKLNKATVSSSSSSPRSPASLRLWTQFPATGRWGKCGEG